MSQIIIPSSQIRTNGVRIIRYDDIDQFTNPETYLKKVFRQYSGQTIKVARKFFKDGVVESAITEPVPKKGFNSWWRGFTKSFVYVDSENIFLADEFFKGGIQPQLLIMTADKVGTSNYNQFFLDGTTHCVFTPIKDWAVHTLTNCKTKSSEKKYNAIINKITKLEDKYKSGVPTENFQSICDQLQIGIEIDVPSSSLDKNTQYIKTRSQKKPLKNFKFINTRLNHIELNNITNKENYIEKPQQFLNELVHESIINKDFIMWKGHSNNIRQVNTLQAIYKIQEKDGYLKEVNDFEKFNNLKEFKLEYFSNKQLSKFLLNNINVNQSIIFDHPYPQFTEKGYIYEELNKLDLEELMLLEQEDITETEREIIQFIKNSQNLNHIDMTKAYTRGSDCSYYQGYLGKITDFRKTDKIEGLGIYMIHNIKNIPPLLQKLKVLYEYNAYPSPELEFYKSLGITFDIVLGCWGSSNDINFGNDWNEGMFKKEYGIRHYCRWYGCLQKVNKYERYNFNCENLEFAKLNNRGSSCDIRFNEYEKTGIIEYKKTKAYHSAHIASFINSYCRISMIEQLLKFKDINQIIAVQVDGIYYKGDVEIGKLFSIDKKPKGIKYIYGQEYIIDVENDLTTFSNIANHRINNKIEIHTGQGGAGKTHNNLIDKGLISPLYIAPSWKLARNKQINYNIDSSVYYYLVSNDPDLYLPLLQNYNTLVFDEISMLSEEDKQIIIKRFKNHKIIFCGDIGYQLPPIEGSQFCTENYPIILHKTNHRCQCNKLKNILNLCRKKIRSGKDTIDDDILKHFTLTDKDDINYSVQDMILAKTHIKKDFYTDKYKNLEKYYIKENTKDYCNGQIIIGQKPQNCKSVLQHAYTIHSVQGETAPNKLFIDMDKMCDLRMFYTAISRAKKYEQIILIK
jgi:hypothetical protein